mmetsp:Transcript_581/g.1485  ORF Transcript_581/g.1485 Transcript_581/m.1485 type:complete len:270 (+) Transcript_581:593-1402(+)
MPPNNKTLNKQQSEMTFRRKTITINEDDVEGEERVVTPAKGQKSHMRRCMSAPTTAMDVYMSVSSIMKWTTLDESIGHSYGSDREGERRGLQFGNVQIREYARTVGDNPSCSSGPPVSISWEYNEVGEIGIIDYEKTRPPRRSHFEMVLPRKVRHDMLRREWDVQQREIAEAVRRNVKIKNQRKSTVNNLDKATKMEEAMESASRKLKRIVLFKKPVSVQVKDLEEKVDQAEKTRKSFIMQQRMSVEYAGETDAVEEAPDNADTSISDE